MATFELEPQVQDDRRGVSFSLARPHGFVKCVIAVKALQEYFWLEPNADDGRILKAFRNGYGRIRAIAERKVLAHPTTHLELTAEDFARP
ncbi:DUF1488 domain-containing protein [Paraburkholderia panacisoli]|uniref:DUF1488 domain-containing protein n=1 Tax=Paraburkholderia panacisoli TaxID=2603818 RepID=A0A5B0GNF5_9BURK|nr:DUF1488 family protein [Paraburkholderia panacisoli]KAA1003450.1 DUF1488 domain-containing protein [Paraburkholderia panacisoli]